MCLVNTDLIMAWFLAPLVDVLFIRHQRDKDYYYYY